jgi:hypothetical protein
MATWQKAKGWTKQRPRRSAGRHREDCVTRIEHDAKNDALLQLVRADFSMLRSDFAGLRGDMLERFGKVDGEITGIKGEITGIRGQIDGLKGEIHGIKDTVEGLKNSLSSTQWLVGAAVALMALLPQMPSMIAAYRFPPPPRSASPAAHPMPSAPEPAASGPQTPAHG